MKCPNCQSKSFYQLANNYIKCKKCTKKISLKKREKDILIVEKFCENKNALQTANELDLHYKTVKDRFDFLRKNIAIFLEDIYHSSIKDYTEYEEYYYLKNSEKKRKKKSLNNSINIIGFYSNQRVYTLLMPSVRNSGLEEDGFMQYMIWYRLRSKNAHQTNLQIFWKYLDNNLRKYKGINKENFFYYIKEYEFKFNYTKSEQLAILNSIV